jgi:hypothetical protein
LELKRKDPMRDNCGRGRIMEGIKESEYGGCTLYTYMKQNNETFCRFK